MRPSSNFGGPYLPYREFLDAVDVVAHEDLTLSLSEVAVAMRVAEPVVLEWESRGTLRRFWGELGEHSLQYRFLASEVAMRIKTFRLNRHNVDLSADGLCMGCKTKRDALRSLDTILAKNFPDLRPSSAALYVAFEMDFPGNQRCLKCGGAWWVDGLAALQALREKGSGEAFGIREIHRREYIVGDAEYPLQAPV